MSSRKVRYWAIGIAFLVLSTVTLWLMFERSNSRQNAIATSQYYATYPAPTPPFIRQLKPAPGEGIASGEQLCASLSIGYFLGANENIDTLGAFLIKNTHITINGEFPFVYQSFSSVWPLANLPNGTPNAELSYCLAENLATGIYSAELKVEDTAGKQYRYTWAFNVE